MKLLGRSNDLSKVAIRKGTEIKELDEMIQTLILRRTPCFDDDDHDPDNRQFY